MPIEDVEEQDGLVVVRGAVPMGANVRDRGGDLARGATVAAAGVRLGPAHLGALAAAGVTAVRCHRVPRVVLAVTGSELRAPGEALEPGQIYDANGLILATQIRSTGATLERLPPVKDDPEALSYFVDWVGTEKIAKGEDVRELVDVTSNRRALAAFKSKGREAALKILEEARPELTSPLFQTMIEMTKALDDARLDDVQRVRKDQTGSAKGEVRFDRTHVRSTAKVDETDKAIKTV